MISASCHTELNKLAKKTDFTIALAGNPNVGKSTVFNQLTGLGAVTANYPGKTVSLNIGTADYHGRPFGIIDLPGIYSLGSISEDQFVARREILEGHADVVVALVDASNLERNLFMVLQLIDLECPLVIACNLLDVAARQHLHIDMRRLSEQLGVPVIPMVATTGEGAEELVRACAAIADAKTPARPKALHYGAMSPHIDALKNAIRNRIRHVPFDLSARAAAIFLLEEDEVFAQSMETEGTDAEGMAAVRGILADIRKMYGGGTALPMIGARATLAHVIAHDVTRHGEGAVPSLATALWRLSIRPSTGLPMLVFGLVAVFALMYYVGGFLSSGFDRLWTVFASPYIREGIFSLFGQGALARTLLWGFDAGIQAALSVGIPYILTFYLVLAFLEDTGYLNSVAFLTDTVMHRLGLHGRSVIPIIAGAGCNVPAIMGTKVLSTTREKIIACTLITLVPCSARTAVIMGAVTFFLGWQWALLIYAIVFVIGMLVGRSMALFLPGTSSGLVMEMFPFRMPKVKTIAKKTWYRFKEFLFIALPIIGVGSVLLGVLYETNAMWFITHPMSLVVEDWLGLPAVAGICLLFGILRKELALQLLMALAVIHYGTGMDSLLSFMTRQQIFIFALVTTLYIPCIATISALIKELGWKTALSISVFTIVLAVVVGGLANQALNFTRILAV